MPDIIYEPDMLAQIKLINKNLNLIAVELVKLTEALQDTALPVIKFPIINKPASSINKVAPVLIKQVAAPPQRAAEMRQVKPVDKSPSNYHMEKPIKKKEDTYEPKK